MSKRSTFFFIFDARFLRSSSIPSLSLSLSPLSPFLSHDVVAPGGQKDSGLFIAIAHRRSSHARLRSPGRDDEERQQQLLPVAAGVDSFFFFD